MQEPRVRAVCGLPRAASTKWFGNVERHLTHVCPSSLPLRTPPGMVAMVGIY